MGHGYSCDAVKRFFFFRWLDAAGSMLWTWFCRRRLFLFSDCWRLFCRPAAEKRSVLRHNALLWSHWRFVICDWRSRFCVTFCRWTWRWLFCWRTRLFFCWFLIVYQNSQPPCLYCVSLKFKSVCCSCVCPDAARKWRLAVFNQNIDITLNCSRRCSDFSTLFSIYMFFFYFIAYTV